MKVRVVTESGGCLTQEQGKQYDIDILPMQIYIGDKTYDDGIDITTEGLFDIMDTGAYAMTSQPKPARARALFEQYVKDGVTDVVAVHMSPGLSGTRALVESTGREYGIKVHTMDTYTTLAVEGYWAKAARELVETGVDPDEIVRRLNVSIEKSKGYLEPYDLNHLAKGGRLTPFAAKFAGMLQIKPICEVSYRTQGKVGMRAKVRTMTKSVKTAVKFCCEDVDDPDKYVFFLMDSRNPEGKEVARQELKKYFPTAVWQEDVLSPVINAHAGMKSVAMQYAPIVEGTTVR